MFSLPEKQEIQVWRGKGENMPPISWGKRTEFLCGGNISFSFETLQRLALQGQSKDLDLRNQGSERMPLCSWERGEIGTKGNVNTILLLEELAAGDAHPTASEHWEEQRDALSDVN